MYNGICSLQSVGLHAIDMYLISFAGAIVSFFNIVGGSFAPVSVLGDIFHSNLVCSKLAEHAIDNYDIVK